MRNLFYALVATLATGVAASADTIDFNAFGNGELPGRSATIDGVTFTGQRGLYIIDSHFENGGMCSFNSSAFNCENDMTIRFNGKVKRLGFGTLGFDEGDLVTVEIYRRGRLLGTEQISSNTRLNLRSYRGVTRLVIDDQSTGAGFSFGDFRFRRVRAGREEAAPEAAVTAPTATAETVVETSADPAAAADRPRARRDGNRAGGRQGNGGNGARRNR